MVANMTISSHARQPQHSSQATETAPPQRYAWLFKSDPSKPASKADIGSLSAMIPSPDNSANSWETRAFAEDASSLAAGIWPPRAYPCSFCRREFRSAQALGGHMNVHRRDRARLRHSSPPAPAPYRSPLTIPQPRSLFQAHADRHAVDQTGGYLNQSLIKLNSNAPSKSSNSPANTPYTSLTSNLHSNKATSFPLRLQQLASEAAASLMCSQQSKSSKLVSLWPASMSNPVSFACLSSMNETSMMERAGEACSSSSLSSPPSSSLSGVRPPRTDTASAWRRDPPIIHPEDESPSKKSHTDSNYNHPILKHIIACRNSLKDELMHAQGIQSSSIMITNNDSSCLERRSVACGGDVDLELRLGWSP
ncbi:hypothetical protein L7F22_013129 [Adiantum nelumboides]|nr:hypothetical protein [Adiantum nelumboides]